MDSDECYQLANYKVLSLCCLHVPEFCIDWVLFSLNFISFDVSNNRTEYGTVKLLRMNKSIQKCKHVWLLDSAVINQYEYLTNQCMNKRGFRKECSQSMMKQLKK